jgi:hypothetical protein
LADVRNRSPKHPSRRRFLSLAVAGGTALAAAAGGAPVEPAAAQAADPLVGSWMSVYHRSTGELLSGLLTFHADGTVINATSDQLSGSTSHGHWRSLGRGEYAYSVMRIEIDPEGNFAGFRAIDADVTLDPSGSNWTSMSRTSYYDVSGALLRTLTSTATANRIPFQRRTDPIPQNVIQAPAS